MLKRVLIIVLMAFPLLAKAGQLATLEKADSVVVIKSKSALYLKRAGKVLKKYHIAMGPHPKGHKEREGDGRTPEGFYVLDKKNTESRYYKSIHISYPNDADLENALEKGFKPGGAIMIHGQKNGYEGLAAVTQRFNWTKGCLALTNKDMDEIWDAVEIGTPIEIRP